MKILVLNAWSSSLKYQLFDMEHDIVLAKWVVEKIWFEDSFLKHTRDELKETVNKPLPTHKDALQLVLDVLVAPSTWVLSSLDDLSAIGHRVVHGGEYFSDPVIITDEVIEKITLCSDLAPLHNPANLQAILACKDVVPQLTQVAMFDTAFHQTMEEEHYLYALPKKYYDMYKVRKYWFHGISHQYVYETLCAQYDLEGKGAKVITCHIGNGASITAIVDGKVIETSMGMTPLQWLMMGTRCGDIDPAIIPYLMKHENLTYSQIDSMLNKESWLLGVSGVSSDLRDVEDGIAQWHADCIVAVNMYVNAIVKYIWAYTALMGGVDYIVLTAGVMENSDYIREQMMRKLGWLGITFDQAANTGVRGECFLSLPGSAAKVMVIPTNEELMIAKATLKLINN